MLFVLGWMEGHDWSLDHLRCSLCSSGQSELTDHNEGGFNSESI